MKDEAVTTWVKPKLVAEVKFTEWTTAGEMRHPAFLGLREDKRAETSSGKKNSRRVVADEPASLLSLGLCACRWRTLAGDREAGTWSAPRATSVIERENFRPATSRSLPPCDQRAPQPGTVVSKPVTQRRPLLIIDGDSFAHRSYHALPKTIRRRGDKGAGAILGFANFLLRLYETEKPRAVLVGWDSLDEPTYRHEALEGYQSGRTFDDELVDQLEVPARFCGRLWFRKRQARRLRGR